MDLSADVSDILFYEPGKPHGLAHNPLLSIIAPRPIGWIGTRSSDGVGNLAPYSFFNLLSGAPPIIAFCSNGPKDSATNVADTGEFSWNLATRPLAEAMNVTSSVLAPDVDEFRLAGLTPVQGRMIQAPMIAESPVTMECRVTQIMRLKDLDGNILDGQLILGQVVGVHIARAVIVNGSYDILRARPICRAGGTGDYFEAVAEGYFHLPRP